jgi:WD40 repeat protein
VHFWITKTGKDLQMWGYPTKVKELAWDPTSRYLATGGGSEITVWDCSGKGPANTTPLQLKLHRAFVSALAYQSGGNKLASGGQDGSVGIWQPDTSKKPLGQAQFDAGVSQIAWSPDGHALAVGCESGAVEVFAL